MKFENIRVMNFKNALHGMRNPKNSWHLSDSVYGICHQGDLNYIADNVYSLYDNHDNFIDYRNNGIVYKDDYYTEYAYIGPNDMRLAQILIKSGPEHRKFLRQIFVSVDITAPLYWWKEFDTYKVGTVANSTSTMHKITSKPITLDCFEIDDYNCILNKDKKSVPEGVLIPYLEKLRTDYLEVVKEDSEQAKIIWKELIRWLPESWLQTRTVTMNYENLLSICSRGQRRFHKLTEWSGDGDDFITPSFIKFARSLPYSQDFIFIDENEISIS